MHKPTQYYSESFRKMAIEEYLHQLAQVCGIALCGCVLVHHDIVINLGSI